MICLDHSTPPPTTAIEQARERGWAFGWSERYQEVVMFTRDARWKQAILDKYTKGVSVYTLGEVEVVQGMSEDARKATHLLMREFGARLE